MLFAVNFVSKMHGRVRLELNGYQYMVKNNRRGRRYQKCMVPLCPATVNTHYETITKSANYHTHVRANRHRPWHTNSSYSQTSSMEMALSILDQLNLLNSTHCTQWSTMSCTHSSLDYYPVKVKKYTTVTSTYSRLLVNNINTTCILHRLRNSYT